MENFNQLKEVIAKLRDPKDGCPWDLKQTHKTLITFLLEESHEFADAVLENDYTKMEEEIGDVLLQVLLHCQIASEDDQFDIESVSKVLADKMIRRHPHVFAPDKEKITEQQVKENWQKIKDEENKDKREFYINEKDNIFPALHSAYKIGKKTSKVNFDWDHVDEVIAKVEEELEELKVELKNSNKEKALEEMGDLLFSVAQVARHLGEDPEVLLKQANKKFTKRFNHLEDMVIKDNKKIQQTSREELEKLWGKVKKL